jgi:hypothetical protein
MNASFPTCSQCRKVMAFGSGNISNSPLCIECQQRNSPYQSSPFPPQQQGSYHHQPQQPHQPQQQHGYQSSAQNGSAPVYPSEPPAYGMGIGQPHLPIANSNSTFAILRMMAVLAGITVVFTGLAIAGAIVWKNNISFENQSDISSAKGKDNEDMKRLKKELDDAGGKQSEIPGFVKKPSYDLVELINLYQTDIARTRPMAKLKVVKAQHVVDGVVSASNVQHAMVIFLSSERNPKKPTATTLLNFMVTYRGTKVFQQKGGDPLAMIKDVPIPRCTSLQAWKAIEKTGVPRGQDSSWDYHQSTGKGRWIVQFPDNHEFDRKVDATTCKVDSKH